MISLICKEYNVNEEWLRNGTGEMFNPEPCDELDSLADKFNLSHGEYIFLEKSVPDIDIDAEVEAYRKQLELQKKAAAESSLSRGGNDEGTGKKEA